MERRPRLPPCFPTSRARANSSPARSARAGEAPGAIFEELRSAIFAAYAAIVDEDRVVGAEHDRRQSALSGVRVTTRTIHDDGQPVGRILTTRSSTPLPKASTTLAVGQ